MSVFQMVYSNMQTAQRAQIMVDVTGHYLPDWQTRKYTVNEFQCLTEALENTDHTFLFIITKQQWDGWRRVCKTYGYDEYTLYEQPYFVHNFNYTVVRGFNESNGGGRRLRVVVLKGKGKHED